MVADRAGLWQYNAGRRSTRGYSESSIATASDNGLGTVDTDGVRSMSRAGVRMLCNEAA